MMRIDTEIVDGVQVRTTEFGDRVVQCENCGADCIWQKEANGWILCELEASGQEAADMVHYCNTPPDFLEQQQEDIAEGNQEEATES